MNNISFLLVAGFYSSGSSAVVDLLKEYEHVYECDAEIRFIKDPGGICDLETALVNKWELINSSNAIQEFLRLCKVYARPASHFPLAPLGLSYASGINKDFLKISQEYVNKLTDYTYKSDFYAQKIKKSYLQYVIDRCRHGLELSTHGKIKSANRNVEPSYFAHPSSEEFCQATKEYFQELFQPHAVDEEESYIVLDQAVSPNNCGVVNRYFDNAKMIIIDRDPRDMYVDDIVNWGVIFDDDCGSREAGLRYSRRQKQLRKDIIESDKVLYIRFEDLVLNYGCTSVHIAEFAGFNETQHVSPKKFLIPEKSSKNVGIWKKHYEEFKDAIDAITETVPELCYRNNRNHIEHLNLCESSHL